MPSSHIPNYFIDKWWINWGISDQQKEEVIILQFSVVKLVAKKKKNYSFIELQQILIAPPPDA